MVEDKLPKWQSHKQVWADKVVGTAVRRFGEPAIKDDTFIDWILACGEIVAVSHELRRRGGKSPNGDPIGGYYVRYKDGFESWSPAEAFEEGYTRIPNSEEIDPTR